MFVCVQCVSIICMYIIYKIHENVSSYPSQELASKEHRENIFTIFNEQCRDVLLLIISSSF